MLAEPLELVDSFAALNGCGGMLSARNQQAPANHPVEILQYWCSSTNSSAVVLQCGMSCQRLARTR